MSRRIVLTVVLAGAAALGVYGWLTATPSALVVVAEAAFTPDLANGQTTFNAGGCSSCHAVPGQPDRLKLGGGLALASPFGTFYVPNISPDPTDGIGRWTEAQFVTAVTKGFRHRARIISRRFPIRLTRMRGSATSGICSPI